MDVERRRDFEDILTKLRRNLKNVQVDFVARYFLLHQTRHSAISLQTKRSLMRQGNIKLIQRGGAWTSFFLSVLLCCQSTASGIVPSRCDEVFKQVLPVKSTQRIDSEKLNQALENHFISVHTEASESLSPAEKRKIFSELTQTAIQEGIDPSELSKIVRQHAFNKILNMEGGSNYVVLDQDRLDKLKKMPFKMRLQSSPEIELTTLLEEKVQKTERLYPWDRLDLEIESIPLFESVQAMPDSLFARKMKPYFKKIETRNIKYVRHLNSDTIEALLWVPEQIEPSSMRPNEFSYVWIMLQKKKGMDFNASTEKWIPVAFYSFPAYLNGWKGNPSVVPFVVGNEKQLFAFILKETFVSDNGNYIHYPSFEWSPIHFQNERIDLSEIPNLTLSEVELFQGKMNQSINHVRYIHYKKVPSLYFNSKQKIFTLVYVESAISGNVDIPFVQISANEQNDFNGFIKFPISEVEDRESIPFIYVDPIHSLIIFSVQSRDEFRVKSNFYKRDGYEWGPQENVRYILPKHDLEIVPKD